MVYPLADRWMYQAPLELRNTARSICRHRRSRRAKECRPGLAVPTPPQPRHRTTFASTIHRWYRARPSCRSGLAIEIGVQPRLRRQRE